MWLIPTAGSWARYRPAHTKRGEDCLGRYLLGQRKVELVAMAVVQGSIHDQLVHEIPDQGRT